MKFNGSEKQNKWAEKIIKEYGLTDGQIDNLLRFSGPTMHSQNVMDVTIIIENRRDLARYADSLGEFYKLSQHEKRTVAINACNALREMSKI